MMFFNKSVNYKQNWRLVNDKTTLFNFVLRSFTYSAILGNLKFPQNHYFSFVSQISFAMVSAKSRAEKTSLLISL